MIHELIQGIIAELTVEGSSPAVAPDYIHGWRGQLNLRLDEIQNDVVWLLPVYSNSTLRGNYLKDDYSIVMGFFGKTELEMFAEQHLPVINRQRRQAAKFIYKIKQSPLFASVSDFEIVDEYNTFDVGISGVTVKFKASPLESLPVC